MERIEPATPAEIAWASANVRPLTSPDPLLMSDHLSPLEDRWVRAARTLGVFTPTLLYQHACGSTRDIKPMIQRMLDAGIIAQVQQAKRFVCPAVFRWIGDGSPPTLDTTQLDPPDAETTEERWRNAARTLGVFTQDALRELAMSSKDWIKPMLGLMLSSGEIIQIQARKRVRHGQPALYQWIGGSGSPPPTCR